MTDIILSYMRILNETDIDNLAKQLQLLNNNMSILIETIGSQSFWNSQLFAAIIGASSAIAVLLIQQLWNLKNNRKNRMDKIYKWICAQYGFWAPRSLFENASNTSYSGTEKPIGEKMVIDLRSHVKYWRYPNYRLRRYFKEYEHSLLSFNVCSDKNYEKYFSNSELIFEKIKDIAFKKTGENEWTIR